jgi:hypothetical protein
MTPAGSGGGGRPGRGAPVKAERLKRRQLARVKAKPYDRQAYDGCQKQEREE